MHFPSVMLKIEEVLLYLEKNAYERFNKPFGIIIYTLFLGTMTNDETVFKFVEFFTHNKNLVAVHLQIRGYLLENGDSLLDSDIPRHEREITILRALLSTPNLSQVIIEGASECFPVKIPIFLDFFKCIVSKTPAVDIFYSELNFIDKIKMLVAIVDGLRKSKVLKCLRIHDLKPVDDIRPRHRIPKLEDSHIAFLSEVLSNNPGCEIIWNHHSLNTISENVLFRLKSVATKNLALIAMNDSDYYSRSNGEYILERILLHASMKAEYFLKKENSYLFRLPTDVVKYVCNLRKRHSSLLSSFYAYELVEAYRTLSSLNYITWYEHVKEHTIYDGITCHKDRLLYDVSANIYVIMFLKNNPLYQASQSLSFSKDKIQYLFNKLEKIIIDYAKKIKKNKDKISVADNMTLTTYQIMVLIECLNTGYIGHKFAYITLAFLSQSSPKFLSSAIKDGLAEVELSAVNHIPALKP